MLQSEHRVPLLNEVVAAGRFPDGGADQSCVGFSWPEHGLAETDVGPGVPRGRIAVGLIGFIPPHPALPGRLTRGLSSGSCNVQEACAVTASSIHPPLEQLLTEHPTAVEVTGYQSNGHRGEINNGRPGFKLCRLRCFFCSPEMCRPGQKKLKPRFRPRKLQKDSEQPSRQRTL